ncbi:MAG: tyrosine-protein phosphatase [Clostridia bacterium]|nr:tyrosine-protein phosphatase [Clostridia bacterium]
MLKSKLISSIVVVLLSCCTIFPMGCRKTYGTVTEQTKTNELFSKVTISQTNGDVQYMPTITASPSEKVEIPLLSGDIYTVCANYELYITDDYKKDNTDIFAPTPITISWESAETPLYFVFDLSTNADMSNSESYVTFDNSITFEYLFMGYDYYYQIQAKFEDRIVKSRVFEFSTSYLPRTIYVDDNVSNTRDWGGYLCGNGTMRVKQGIVYRGGALETITAKGKDVMLNKLGIKTDLDVRGDGSATSNRSPLGVNVNYIETKGPYYLGTVGIDFGKGTLSDERQAYKDALITEIKAFANPDNFPIYVHCSLGRDRTGTLCFLINALLGVSETDLYRDYEISMMSATGTKDGQTAKYMVGTAFKGLYNYIKRYSYKDLAGNAEKYLLDLGITQEEIDAIKANMLEEVE